MDFLVQQIVNLPLGMPCFLCLTMHGQECIWEEIGGEMLSEGNKILDWYKKSKGQGAEAKMHCAACYYLYHHYTCVMTELGCRGDCVQVPDCVEKYIKYAYLAMASLLGSKNALQRNAREILL